MDWTASVEKKRNCLLRFRQAGECNQEGRPRAGFVQVLPRLPRQPGRSQIQKRPRYGTLRRRARVPGLAGKVDCFRSADIIDAEARTTFVDWRAVDQLFGWMLRRWRWDVRVERNASDRCVLVATARPNSHAVTAITVAACLKSPSTGWSKRARVDQTRSTSSTRSRATVGCVPSGGCSAGRPRTLRA